MYNIRYLCAKTRAKVCGKMGKDGDEIMNQFFRKHGILLGGRCHIYSNILTSEPYLICIGDNVTISSDVIFITHDNSIIKVDSRYPNIFGKIVVGNNCFIGQHSIILYGVSLSNNIIVAAGSVVCNSFDEERIIIAGNPARIVGRWDAFAEKGENYGLGRKNAKKVLLNNPERLVKKGVRYD